MIRRRWWWLYVTLAITALAFPTAEVAHRLARPSETEVRIERLQDRIADYQARIIVLDRRASSERDVASRERAELLERIERLRVEIRDAGGTPPPAAPAPRTTTTRAAPPAPTTTVRPPPTTRSAPTTTTSTTRPRRPCTVRVNRVACIRTQERP